jgi:hypothetical protein
MLETAREHNMAIEPICARGDLRKRHPHLEGDARSFGKHANWTEFVNCPNYLVEQFTNLRPPAREMVREIVATAGVRLVAIRKITPALRAPPHR